MNGRARDDGPRQWVFWLDRDAWHEIWETLRRNRLRAFLTACGVFWGIFMLVVMLGIGNGLRAGVVESMGGFVMPTVYVWGQRTTIPHAGLQPGRRVHFHNADIATVKAVAGVQTVEPRVRLGDWRIGANVSVGPKTSNFNVLGDTPLYPLVEPMTLLRGRFIDPLDMDEQRKVAVIGDQVRRYFFGENGDPIGRYIKVQGVYFLIVGEITGPKIGDEEEKLPSAVVIPFSTFQAAFNRRDQVHWFALGADASEAPAVEKRVRQALSKVHRIHPDDKQALGSFNVAEKTEQFYSLFRGIQAFVWFVGGLTLLAGVLGVSNILLIIVKERTKEIGIRKALGAEPLAIMGLIVEESLALTALAGYAGLTAGVAVLELVGRAFAKVPNAPLSHPAIDLKTAVGATLVLMVSGLVAAIVPARRAALIHPVEALKAE